MRNGNRPRKCCGKLLQQVGCVPEPNPAQFPLARDRNRCLKQEMLIEPTSMDAGETNCKERWLSGRKRRFAKSVKGSNPSAGSNPVRSAYEINPKKPMCFLRVVFLNQTHLAVVKKAFSR